MTCRCAIRLVHAAAPPASSSAITAKQGECICRRESAAAAAVSPRASQRTMAGCPAGVAVSSSSMESTCLRTSSLLKCAPAICGHNMSSPVMRSNESLAFLPGLGVRPAGSDAAGSLNLVAICTDTLRESSDSILLHCNFATLAAPPDASRLMEDPHGNEEFASGLESHFRRRLE